MSMILNPYRYAGASVPTFGNASRDFDGSDDYVSNGSESLKFTQDDSFSIAAWINVDVWGADKIVAGNASLNLSSDGFYFRTLSSSKIRMIIGSAGGEYIFKDSDNTLPSEVWIHFAATYDGSNTLGGLKLYIDGVLQPSSGGQAGIIDIENVASFYFGASLGTAAYFNGQISDARIYNVELSAADVANIVDGTHVSSDLVLWSFLDNDDVLDYSGNGNDGTNNGSTYSTDGPFD